MQKTRKRKYKKQNRTRKKRRKRWGHGRRRKRRQRKTKRKRQRGGYSAFKAGNGAYRGFDSCPPRHPENNPENYRNWGVAWCDRGNEHGVCCPPGSTCHYVMGPDGRPIMKNEQYLEDGVLTQVEVPEMRCRGHRLSGTARIARAKAKAKLDQELRTKRRVAKIRGNK